MYLRREGGGRGRREGGREGEREGGREGGRGREGEGEERGREREVSNSILSILGGDKRLLH